MTSQAGTQIITVHIFRNTSRSKGNQTIKFGQLIEYKVRKIFLQKLSIKQSSETCSRPPIFLKKLYLM